MRGTVKIPLWNWDGLPDFRTSYPWAVISLDTALLVFLWSLT